jgi:hypothetical protein
LFYTSFLHGSLKRQPFSLAKPGSRAWFLAQAAASAPSGSFNSEGAKLAKLGVIQIKEYFSWNHHDAFLPLPR